MGNLHLFSSACLKGAKHAQALNGCAVTWRTVYTHAEHRDLPKCFLKPGPKSCAAAAGLHSQQGTLLIRHRQRAAWLAGAQGCLQAHSMPAVLPVLIFDGPHRVLGILLVVGSRVQPQHDCSAAEDILGLGAQHLLRSMMQKFNCT